MMNNDYNNDHNKYNKNKIIITMNNNEYLSKSIQL